MQPRERVLIAGPGRSGTSALVTILARVGVSTTADGGHWFEDAGAGYEAELDLANSPYVVKNPNLTYELPVLLETGAIAPDDIRMVLIPVRELGQAAASRWLRSKQARRIKTPGGLWRTSSPRRQERILAGGLWDLLVALERHDVPYRLMLYPRFVVDFPYLERAISDLLTDGEHRKLQAAWDDVSSGFGARGPLSPAGWRDSLRVLTFPDHPIWASFRYRVRRLRPAPKRV